MGIETSRPRKQANRKSPYVKYNKSPYVYGFKNCLHKGSHFQSTPQWSGRVCDACNIITQGPPRRDF